MYHKLLHSFKTLISDALLVLHWKQKHKSWQNIVKKTPNVSRSLQIRFRRLNNSLEVLQSEWGSFIKWGFRVTISSLFINWSPVVSSSYRRASDFLNYSPGLASDSSADKQKKEKLYLFFKNCFLKQPWMGKPGSELLSGRLDFEVTCPDWRVISKS